MTITLKAARVNAGYTQCEVAKKLGISTVTVHAWETMKSFPDINQAKALCELYGMSIDELFFAK